MFFFLEIFIDDLREAVCKRANLNVNYGWPEL